VSVGDDEGSGTEAEERVYKEKSHQQVNKKEGVEMASPFTPRLSLRI
jgi:hypothetical protein